MTGTVRLNLARNILEVSEFAFISAAFEFLEIRMKREVLDFPLCEMSLVKWLKRNTVDAAGGLVVSAERPALSGDLPVHLRQRLVHFVFLHVSPVDWSSGSLELMCIDTR